MRTIMSRHPRTDRSRYTKTRDTRIKNGERYQKVEVQVSKVVEVEKVVEEKEQVEKEKVQFQFVKKFLLFIL